MAGTNSTGTTDAFAEVCEAIAGLMAQVVREEILTRYRIGVLLRTVRSGAERYGERPIERIAAKLEVGVDTLYRCAMVAEQWSKTEVHMLCAQVNRRGEPLSWSHLVALTKVYAPATRAALAERALAEAWTVRELTSHLAAHRGVRALDRDRSPSAEGQPSKQAESLADMSVRAALSEGVHSASRALTQMGVFVDALDERLAEGDGHDRLFDEAIGVYEALQDKVGAALELLRRARATSSARLRVVPRVRVGRPVVEELTEDEDRPLEPRRVRLRR